VTFLHVARSHPTILPPPFQVANYDFGDRRLWTSELCGIALLDYLTVRGDGPTRLLILGTPGSSWASMVAFVLGPERREALIELHERCAAGAVATADLEPWLAPVTQALRDRIGCKTLDVALQLTGYANDEAGQREMIGQIAEQVDFGGRMVVDATHSLRHLPLIGVFSAMTLRRLKSVTLDGVYYGVLERSAADASGVNRTPVWRLDGLNVIAEWVAALGAFDKDGDYGVFAPLLVDAGFDEKAASNLADAAFNEMIGDFGSARERLLSFRNKFNPAALRGAARLFGQELIARTAWADAATGLLDRQRRLAWAALRRGDAVRAATWGFEAFVTKLSLQDECDPLDSEARDKAKKRYVGRNESNPVRDAYNRLRIMRNQIAHIDFQMDDTDPVRNEVLRTMMTRESCVRALRSYLEVLIPLEPSEPVAVGGHIT
jgi:CRISPR-associated Csx2 family protein